MKNFIDDMDENKTIIGLKYHYRYDMDTSPR